MCPLFSFVFSSQNGIGNSFFQESEPNGSSWQPTVPKKSNSFLRNPYAPHANMVEPSPPSEMTSACRTTTTAAQTLFLFLLLLLLWTNLLFVTMLVVFFIASFLPLLFPLLCRCSSSFVPWIMPYRKCTLPYRTGIILYTYTAATVGRIQKGGALARVALLFSLQPRRGDTVGDVLLTREGRGERTIPKMTRGRWWITTWFVNCLPLADHLASVSVYPRQRPWPLFFRHSMRYGSDESKWSMAHKGKWPRSSRNSKLDEIWFILYRNMPGNTAVPLTGRRLCHSFAHHPSILCARDSKKDDENCEEEG